MVQGCISWSLWSFQSSVQSDMFCMNKTKQGKRDRESEMESDGVVCTILYRVSR